MAGASTFVICLLLQLTSFGLAHARNELHNHPGVVRPEDAALDTTQDEFYNKPSYADLHRRSGTMIAHIGLMVIAWFFILPLVVMFSIAKSRLALPVNLAFFIINSLGVIVGTIYNAITPDLYEHNAHHSIGWIATWIATTWLVLSFKSSSRLLRASKIMVGVIDRAILILGFVALLTGGVTYVGIFRGNHVFNGLAHFIKGSIFFWYGLLTLGRWTGCFADVGWAWNVNLTPSRIRLARWAVACPSAEFVESFLIFLYGTTNVFLEHLANWGGAWTAQDLEHVSISIMFFGGGLCGMLAESNTIRTWLNTTARSYSARNEAIGTPTKTHKVYTNPVPALIIFLLGIMMSSHHQDSMTSTKVHKQWGLLLSGSAVMRVLTYLVIHISPPTSIYPSRPPFELLSSFCLISGGIVFMASSQDIVHCMELNDLMPMFIFTIAVGLTAFVMAWEILVLSLKGWAVRREAGETSRADTPRY
ncbi:hypothetical protein H2200_001330 [Cladophialophora chaetospira]|uniref:Integral membrane protein n=1 Tax=Cladophialophora chaetospira TaxID=386627 RepID=A0AA38XKS9_9EURO|nr:hypothetical protein H2200_001330 [Cladophialophora chaetospira]